MSQRWIAGGHQVTVVTGMPNHPTGVIPSRYRGRLFMRESRNDVNILRSWIYASPNQAGPRKLLGHLSFALTSGLLSGTRVGKTDAVIISSPTLFAAFPAWLTARARRASFILEVRDLWPDIFVGLGVLREGHVLGLLRKMSCFLYRRADLVVPVTEGFAKAIIAHGIPAAKVSVVTNGADLGWFGADLRDAAKQLRIRLGLERRFVVAYIGAHGMSQGLMTIIDVADQLRERDDIRFLLVGDGSERATLVHAVKDRGLDNVVMLSQQPSEQVREFYAAADVCLVPLREIPLFDSFIPSKIFEIMAAGRPIIGSVRGEARVILEASGAAALADPECADQIASAILELQGSPERLVTMGRAGRTFAERYSREALAARYADLIQGVAR